MCPVEEVARVLAVGEEEPPGNVRLDTMVASDSQDCVRADSSSRKREREGP